MHNLIDWIRGILNLNQCIKNKEEEKDFELVLQVIIYKKMKDER